MLSINSVLLLASDSDVSIEIDESPRVLDVITEERPI